MHVGETRLLCSLQCSPWITAPGERSHGSILSGDYALNRLTPKCKSTLPSEKGLWIRRNALTDCERNYGSGHLDQLLGDPARGGGFLKDAIFCERISESTWSDFSCGGLAAAGAPHLRLQAHRLDHPRLLPHRECDCRGPNGQPLAQCRS
jgi:hypothetical protein